jgi:SAM-dependent methyltransferase
MSDSVSAGSPLSTDYFQTFTDRYNQYQQRYAAEPPERDKVLIRLIAEIVSRRSSPQPLSLLDIGCSTGMFLKHLRDRVPNLTLTGADLAATAVADCRANPELQGIRFEVNDILNLTGSARYDIVVANAVAVYFENSVYDRSIAEVSKLLKPGGWYLAFEWLHAFQQDLKIIETSRSHPEGLEIHFRPYHVVRPIFKKHGFSSVEFFPFSIPIDLPRGKTSSDNRDGFEDLNSYTVPAETGDRLLFRGTLFQPWCHLVAQKAN